MAINPATQYPGQIAAPTPSYPYGAAQNITNPGDQSGTPWEKALINDVFGFQQALLAAAGITPSGVPDNAQASQYLQAVQQIAAAQNLKTNIAATAPGAGNDSTEGYSVFSLWLNTTNNIFYACADNTATAAIWAPLNDTAGLGRILARVRFSYNPPAPAIIEQVNVSSVTRAGNGRYDIDFTNALPDTNYSAFLTWGQNAAADRTLVIRNPLALLTTSIEVGFTNASESNYIDAPTAATGWAMVTIIG